MSKPVSFEAIKLALKQDRHGHVLTLIIHPNETPDELWRTPAGQRYGVALVRLDEEAAAHADDKYGERVFKMAMARCRDKPFQQWLANRPDAIFPDGDDMEAATQEAVKLFLGIASMKEVRDNPVVRENFLELIRNYEDQR